MPFLEELFERGEKPVGLRGREWGDIIDEIPFMDVMWDAL
jgi:hypothetical protein